MEEMNVIPRQTVAGWNLAKKLVGSLVDSNIYMVLEYPTPIA